MATASRRQYTEPTYKQHFAVDDKHGVFVDAISTHGNINEGNIIRQLVERVEVLLGRRASVVTADSGYNLRQSL